ncbi:MAG: Trk system potassium transporter TrkA [bacterium]|nr:Trk system potassium transporter TrkA [bacterium]
MKIIIFGANEIGATIVSQFSKENDITVIDNERKKSDIQDKFDVSYVVGSASDIEVLKTANIKDAELFIACTDSDELNIIACLTAKKFCNICTMCFVKKEGYKSSLGYAKDADYNSEFYIDYVIWPEELLTQEIFRIITVAKALDVENFANGRARLLEYKIAGNSVLVNKTVKSCGFPKETLIVGITRGDDLFIPSGETVLQEDDKVIFMGLSHSLDVLAGMFFHEKELVKKVVIIGGGEVGLRLAKNLEALKYKLKIVEKSEARCEFLAEELSNTLVIHGDGTDLELLTEEEIGSADVVVSVTNNDEKNLLCSLMAKQLGVNRVISRVSAAPNASLFEKVGIDVTISMQTAALNEIKSNVCGPNIGILATVEQGKGEVMNILLPQDYEGKKVMDLKLPAKGVIGIIQRRNRVIIPNGATQVLGDDNLIIFTTSENATLIREYFKVK